jgi:DNA-binding SARP family transcriptional activator
MGLRLLGPLELVVGGQALKVGGPKEQVVLAALALNANRATAIDHLVEAVWGMDPPSSARMQIQKCVHGLRKLFNEVGQPGTIRTSPPGYLLDIPPGELDHEEFARLVGVARKQVAAGGGDDAAASLREALALWRGPALAGVRSDLVQRQAALLNDARFAAIEERVRLDLAMGRHEELVNELNGLIDSAPLRERLYGYRMLALYRSGRQAEALEVFRRARTTLIDEVGVEPGQELRDLERAILNRDPALDVTTSGSGSSRRAGEQPAGQPRTPRPLPGSTADFVGREAHIAEIKSMLSGEASFAVRVLVISGKGGVGKSTLALRVAHELSDAYPHGHLYADLEDPDAGERPTTLLARFLRALGVVGSAMPEGQRERAELYRSLLANKQLLVVLDGVTSEEQVIPLLPGTGACPVIATSRARLTGLPGARLIDIEVFDTNQSVELLAKIVGPERVRVERDAAAELVRLCGGLPLALRIAGGRLASRPQLRVAGLVRRLADETRRLDELSHRGLELRASIGLTYRGLPVQARRLFRLFALVPAPDFPGWTAAALLDIGQNEADDALAHLVDAHVVDMLEYPSGRIRFRLHDLIRLYAHEQLMETEPVADRRDALGRVLGAWLALAERAYRKEYGGDYSILHGSASRWHPVEEIDIDPDDDPMEWWESERRALIAGVRKAAAEGMDELCWDLACTLANLFEVKGHFDDWAETARLALEATERAGNRFGRAAALYSLGALYIYQKRLTDAEQCLADALEIFEEEGSTLGRALVLRVSASVDRMQGNIPMMLDRYERAQALMREVGDPVGEAYILRNLAKFQTDEGNLDAARVMLDEALTLCQKVNYRRGEAQTLSRFAGLHLVTGNTALARQEFQRVLRIVRDIGDRTGEAHALYGLGLIRRQEGKLDSAETTLVHALTLSLQVGERLIEAQARYALGGIQLARGNNPVAETHLEKARDHFADLGTTMWQAKTLLLLSEVHVDDDHLATASREIDEAARLLAPIDSKEAARLRGQLEETRSALQPLGVVGRGAESE